jgi:hypothetical protein
MHQLIRPSLDDPPAWSEENYRGVVSKLESLHAVADLITDQDIENFFLVSHYVLSEDDPALDLEKEDRWAANVYDKVRNHSGAIRESLFQNLIIFSVHGNGLFGKRLGINLELLVNRLVRELLHSQDERVWMAQKNDLPSYAEAAPEVFLSIVEEEAKKDKPGFDALFTPVTGMFSGCDRTGMLWALELIAWNPSFLSRVIMILGRLSLYELDDNWSNKPLNSIKDILLCWKPHTGASVEERCEVLELLCTKFPTAGWQLCTQPLKTELSMTSGTHRPSWRNYASGAEKTVTHGEARQYALKCLELAINWPTHNFETLKDLVSCLASVDETTKEKIIGNATEWVKNSPDPLQVARLREHVRTTTMTRRARKNLKNNSYADGRKLYDILEPNDPLLKHRYLFTSSWVEYTPEELEEEELDFDARDKILKELKVSALQEIIKVRGIDGIHQLVANSGAGYTIGYHLFHEILDEKSISDFALTCIETPSEKSPEVDSCLSGILYQFSDNKRVSFVNTLFSNIRDDEQYTELVVRLLKLAPFDRITWDITEKHSDKVQFGYWAEVFPGWNKPSPNDLNYAISKLLQAKRPRAALHFAHLEFKSVETKLLITILADLAVTNSEVDEHFKPGQYEIEDALIELDKRDNFERIELINLEYLYIDILHFHSRYGIPNLSKYVADSPLFYFQLIALVFKRKDGGHDPDEWDLPSDQDKKEIAATKAYHVLDSLDVIPGTNDDGTINIEKLRAWIEQVRSLAQNHSRLDVTDQKVGKLLSTATEENGIWPKNEVCVVLEEFSSEEMATGMEIGHYNAQNATFRSVNAERERSKSADFREMSKKVANKYPFVAKMLANIAKSYDRDAERWEADGRVSKRIRGW